MISKIFPDNNIDCQRRVRQSRKVASIRFGYNTSSLRYISLLGTRMKPLLIVLPLFSLAAVVGAQSEEKPILTVGIISLEVFPGRPNYDSIKDGDEAENAWVLTTANGGKVERFQLVVADGSEEKFAMLRRSIGKKVRVEGSVWEAHTGHHHTPFLITVKSIEREPNQSSLPIRPSVTPRARARGAPASLLAGL